MGFVGWIAIGLIAGGLARVATGSEKRGCLGTMVVGLIGALIGGWLFNVATEDKDRFTHFSLGSVAVAFVGASVLLLLLQALSRKPRGQRR